MRTERTGGTLTDLIVHLYLQLVESEGGLVVIFLLDGVLWPRDHHAGPGVTVGAVGHLEYFPSTLFSSLITNLVSYRRFPVQQAILLYTGIAVRPPGYLEVASSHHLHPGVQVGGAGFTWQYLLLVLRGHNLISCSESHFRLHLK